MIDGEVLLTLRRIEAQNAEILRRLKQRREAAPPAGVAPADPEAPAAPPDPRGTFMPGAGWIAPVVKAKGTLK